MQANVTRWCPDTWNADICGCDRNDPFVQFQCPRGGLSCGCYRCPESFLLHEGFCYEGCPVGNGFRPAFFDAANTAAKHQKPSKTVLSPTSQATAVGDATQVSGNCDYGAVFRMYSFAVECVFICSKGKRVTARATARYCCDGNGDGDGEHPDGVYVNCMYMCVCESMLAHVCMCVCVCVCT